MDNRLEVHKEAGNVPGLQGASERVGSRFDVLQDNWAPGTRLVAGTGGAVLAGIAPTRGWLGVPFGVIGGALLLRSIVNQPVRRLIAQQRGALERGVRRVGEAVKREQIA